MHKIRILWCDDENMDYNRFTDNFLKNHFPQFVDNIECELYDGISLVRKKISESSFDYDIVICDLNFAGDNLGDERTSEGFEIIKEVQALFKDVYCILITGYTQLVLKEEESRAYRDGMQTWLTKSSVTRDACPVCKTLKDPRYNSCPECNEPLNPFFANLKKTLAPMLKHKMETKGLKKKITSKIIYKSKEMENVMVMAKRVANNDNTVLVTGETGTGKELIARLIHDVSPRGTMPFVALNCAAINEQLLDDELFGHEKGAFTDAKKSRKGRFELAEGGTIFLDEIGDMSAGTQARLLRVLEEQELQRLGGEETIKIDVRVIAATNKDLEHEIETDNFRKDLFYRINTIEIAIPPLRSRKDDIAVLVNYFINQSSMKQSLSLTKETIAFLEECPWNGNVRELKNVIEKVVVLYDGDGPVPRSAIEQIINRKSNSINETLSISDRGDRELCENGNNQTSNIPNIPAPDPKLVGELSNILTIKNTRKIEDFELEKFASYFQFYSKKITVNVFLRRVGRPNKKAQRATAGRILNDLEKANFLQVVRQGQGRNPKIYQVTKAVLHRFSISY